MLMIVTDSSECDDDMDSVWWSPVSNCGLLVHCLRWAEAPVKIARMTLTIKLDRNWNSFQLANSAPPLSVTDSAIAPSARMLRSVFVFFACIGSAAAACFIACAGSAVLYVLCLLFRPGFACVSFFLFGCSYCWGPRAPQKFRKSH